jgi:short-subunit dehydrogenase
MVSNNTGQIWTVASILGYFGSPRLAAYSASKFGIIGYFESLQYEMKNTNIHIGILSPGFINTNVTLSSLGPEGEPIGKNSIAQERGMHPKELARIFLRKSRRKNPSKQVFIGGYETLAVLFKRLSPSLFFFIYGKLTDITRKKKS